MSLAQVWTHWSFNWFFLPNPIFAICLNFQQHNSLKNQYLSHLNSKNCEINSIKSDLSPRGFPTTPRTPPNFQYSFSVSILFSFHWENDSIINSFDIVAWNSLKRSHHTLSHWELSEHGMQCFNPSLRTLTHRELSKHGMKCLKTRKRLKNVPYPIHKAQLHLHT